MPKNLYLIVAVKFRIGNSLRSCQHLLSSSFQLITSSNQQKVHFSLLFIQIIFLLFIINLGYNGLRCISSKNVVAFKYTMKGLIFYNKYLIIFLFLLHINNWQLGFWKMWPIKLGKLKLPGDVQWQQDSS